MNSNLAGRAVAVVAGGGLARLEVLQTNNLAAESLVALAHSGLPLLELGLPSSRIEAEATAALANASFVPRLAYLNLNEAMWPHAEEALLSVLRIVARSTRLETLGLNGFSLGDEGAGLSPRTKSLDVLRELEKDGSRVTQKGMCALLASQHLRRLS